ncbi:MAG: hypothetical protein AAGA56_21400 [Myxococcota bacterium]
MAARPPLALLFFASLWLAACGVIDDAPPPPLGVATSASFRWVQNDRCQTDEDCGPFAICEGNRCGVPCAWQGDCEMGDGVEDTCFNGYCVLPEHTNCISDDDCDALAFCDHGGHCRPARRRACTSLAGVRNCVAESASAGVRLECCAQEASGVASCRTTLSCGLFNATSGTHVIMAP